MARWFQRAYPVIILDEPTRGVDVRAKTEVYALINRIVAAGAGILLITSEFAEAIGMADRIAVMARGRIRGILDVRSGPATQERILQMAVGDEGPELENGVAGR
jgi:ABC-type sugar transport system ATPase subunit